MNKVASLLILILFVAACNNSERQQKTVVVTEAPPSQLRQIEVDNSSESFGGDIYLDIFDTTQVSPEITRYRILSMYKDKPVGFDLLLKKPSQKQMFVNDGITFLSLGDTSNNFLQALAEVYKLKKPLPSFVDSVTITYADLGSEVDLSKPGNWIAAQMKLFFQTDDNASELFMNINKKDGTIAFPEKDINYRAGIIEALSKKRK